MKRILVADDEFDIAEALGSILRGDGYEVEVCADGREAIACLRSKAAPSMVLLDAMMPFVSGYEVIQFMKENSGLGEIPIVLMSAVAPAMAQQDGRWDAFLRKPFTIDALIAAVEKYAGKPDAEPGALSGG